MENETVNKSKMLMVFSSLDLGLAYDLHHASVRGDIEKLIAHFRSEAVLEEDNTMLYNLSARSLRISNETWVYFQTFKKF